MAAERHAQAQQLDVSRFEAELSDAFTKALGAGIHHLGELFSAKTAGCRGIGAFATRRLLQAPAQSAVHNRV